MIFSEKALLLALVVAFAPSPFVFAQKEIGRASPLEEFEKSSTLKRSRGEKVPPFRPNPTENDHSDRQRRLDLSTAVHYPNPCIDLPANRVPEFNSTNPVNDGWSLALPAADYAMSNLPLPFTITFDGQSNSAVNINNDGFIYFPGRILDVFSANVDTSGSNGGYVWRKAIGTNKYAVAWDNVGYFPEKTDKLNTFQVIISDGTDASMGLGNNVCYCYGDMQWTQVGYGLVGISASPFGFFNQPGTAYDGGYGNNDGFDFLDNKSICFKVSGSNIPPVAVNVPENNRIDLDCGQSVNNLTIFFLAPEFGQPVSLMTSGASAGLTVDISNQTNQATATINWLPTAAATVNVTLTATDGIDNTTVTVTFTSPSVTAEIWNPKTNKFVQALVNGSKYCLKKYNLRAVVPCPTEPVFLLELWNIRRTKRILLKRQKERVPPYFLWGDKVNNATGSVDVKQNPKSLPNGNYALRIKAINATNSNSFAEIPFKQACKP